MSRRLPRAAMATAEAALPPAGLAGLRPEFSRLVTVPGSGGWGEHTWHLLDNASTLDTLGVTPVGTILCVHGNPTWSYLWRALVAQATDAAAGGSPAWRVIAVDQLEMGFSERTGVARPLARRVRDLGDLTDALALDGPVVTFGHDWGGVVSMGWAVDHPELLAGVMLLNTAIHQPASDPIPAPLRLALRPSVLGMATVTTPAFLETTLALAHPRLAGEVAAGYRAPYRSAERRGGIGGFVADIPVPDSTSAPEHESFAELERIAVGIRSIDRPALMLWGPTDPIFSDRYLDDLVDRMPHADVHRFEGAGHLIAEDVDYAAAALTWLGDREALLLGSTHPPGRHRAAPDASAPRADVADLAGPDLAGPDLAGPDLAGPADVAAPEASASPFIPLWQNLDGLRDSDDTALIEMAPAAGSGARVVSWKLLSLRVRQIAAGLVRVGVKPGHRVSLLIPPGADLTAVLYACLRVGAVVVVADAGLGLRGLTRAARGTWPDHVIGAAPGMGVASALGWPGQRISTATYPAAVARLLGVQFSLADLIALGIGQEDALPEAPAADAPAAILFTSGSTGPAKGVAYTHRQLAGVRDALQAQYGVGTGTGLVAGFAPFALLGPALGARSVTPDMNVTSPRTLTAVAVAEAVAAVDATMLFLSPAALANVSATSSALTPRHHDALSGVRDFLSAGAPVSQGLLAAASALLPNAVAHTPYGMTEALLLTDITLDGVREAESGRGTDASGTSTSGSAVSAGTGGTGGVGGTDDAGGMGDAGGVCVGRPAASVTMLISALDELGRATGEPSSTSGVTGEIVISAPHLKDHYDRLWLTERESRRGTAGLAHAGPAARWHRTGDVGHLDDSGRLWVEGRLPHVITTPRGPLTPVAPEQQLERLPPVARAAIVGVGPVGVQQVVAVVETSPPARRVALADAALAAAVRAAVAAAAAVAPTAAVPTSASPTATVSDAAVPIAAVLVVPQLPTDIRHNSKIDRVRLGRWAGGILSGGRMSKP